MYIEVGMIENVICFKNHLVNKFIDKVEFY